MICKNCNLEYTNEDVFCVECGQKLVQPEILEDPEIAEVIIDVTDEQTTDAQSSDEPIDVQPIDEQTSDEQLTDEQLTDAQPTDATNEHSIDEQVDEIIVEDEESLQVEPTNEVVEVNTIENTVSETEHSDTPNEIPTCPNCHAIVELDSNFCVNCGQNIENSVRYIEPPIQPEPQPLTKKQMKQQEKQAKIDAKKARKRSAKSKFIRFMIFLIILIVIVAGVYIFRDPLLDALDDFMENVVAPIVSDIIFGFLD